MQASSPEARRTFRKWLALQIYREDCIGDFAREVRDAPFAAPRLSSTLFEYEDWVEYIRDAELDVVPAEYVQARLEYVRYRRSMDASVGHPRSITRRKRSRILERDGFRCRRCGNGPEHARLVVDHIIPVALGGDASDSNLQTLCDDCNGGKADRAPHPHDFGGRE